MRKILCLILNALLLTCTFSEGAWAQAQPAPPTPPRDATNPSNPRSQPQQFELKWGTSILSAACDTSKKPAKTTVTKRGSRSSGGSSFQIEWFAARGALGAGAGVVTPFYGMGEIALFTFVWKFFYIEALRGGGGLPAIGYWGTAFGIPWRIGGNPKHQMRFGVHLTLSYGYWPGPSGFQFYYIHRVSEHFAVQFGIMQYSYPPGAAFTFGFSI